MIPNARHLRLGACTRRVAAGSPGAGVAHRKLAFHERPAATVACLARVERCFRDAAAAV